MIQNTNSHSPFLRQPLTWVRRVGVLALASLVAGCSSDVMSPAGHVAVQLRNIMGISTFLMLLIVIPVMVAVCIFAWHYRASNKRAEYDPEFHHSTSLELLTWAAPLTIIVWLGAITWVGTHQLDPYRPLEQIDARTPVDPDVEPLIIQTVSMDWKWMFIYPQYGIATINEVAAPIDRPIKFEMTSTEVMNAFHVPALAGMIYTMAGMQTTLWAVGNDPGVYEGRSSHYSGAGFSGMSFDFHVLEQTEFEDWIGKSTQAEALDRQRYLELAEPSENVEPMFFELADEDLYHAILNRCLLPGEVCMDEQMMNEHARKNGGVRGSHHAGAHGAEQDELPVQGKSQENDIETLSGGESQDASELESDETPASELEPVSLNDNSRESLTGQQN
ncbi:ubiquinol oxidase subunit II [Granulosicoccus sp. 3-233]|uniref:ubiquinol oxidase subunit II n=1 Tax=Granulosicoccus sp. 3-233 TaxID=3417969 RepID=UPI003D33A62A